MRPMWSSRGVVRACWWRAVRAEVTCTSYLSIRAVVQVSSPGQKTLIDIGGTVAFAQNGHAHEADRVCEPHETTDSGLRESPIWGPAAVDRAARRLNATVPADIRSRLGAEVQLNATEPSLIGRRRVDLAVARRGSRPAEHPAAPERGLEAATFEL